VRKALKTKKRLKKSRRMGQEYAKTGLAGANTRFSKGALFFGFDTTAGSGYN